jgi:uncharacterized protein YecA (UPF0149 family)
MLEESRGLENEKNINESSCCSISSCCGTKKPIRRAIRKIGRNDLCPCGSDRKFKKCCGLK